MSLEQRLAAAAEETRTGLAGLDPARRLQQLRRRARRQAARTAAAVAVTVVVAPAALWVGLVRVRQDGAAPEPVRPAGSLPRGSLGRVTARVPVGDTPAAMAAGAGAVWVARPLAGVVVRVDPATNRVVATVPVGHGGSAADFGNFHDLARVAPRVAVAAGAVWVPNPADGTVTRIDPRSNRPVATIRLPLTELPQPRHLPLAVSTRGGVWVTDVRTRTAYRIGPASDTVVGSSPVAVPDGLVAVGDGSLWAQDGSDAGWLLRQVDPDSGRRTTTLPVGSRVGGVAEAAGATWLSDYDQGVVLRVDPPG
jgi:virginiamycin B lyase